MGSEKKVNRHQIKLLYYEYRVQFVRNKILKKVQVIVSLFCVGEEIRQKGREAGS